MESKNRLSNDTYETCKKKVCKHNITFKMLYIRQNANIKYSLLFNWKTGSCSKEMIGSKYSRIEVIANVSFSSLEKCLKKNDITFFTEFCIMLRLHYMLNKLLFDDSKIICSLINIYCANVFNLFHVLLISF